MHLQKHSFNTLVWEIIKQPNLNTGFYFHKYYFILINWKEQEDQDNRKHKQSSKKRGYDYKWLWQFKPATIYILIRIPAFA